MLDRAAPWLAPRTLPPRLRWRSSSDYFRVKQEYDRRKLVKSKERRMNAYYGCVVERIQGQFLGRLLMLEVPPEK